MLSKTTPRLRPGGVYISRRGIQFKIAINEKTGGLIYNPEKSSFLALQWDGVTNAKHWLPLDYDGLRPITGRPKISESVWRAWARVNSDYPEELRQILNTKFMELQRFHVFRYFNQKVFLGQAVFALLRKGDFQFYPDKGLEAWFVEANVPVRNIQGTLPREISLQNVATKEKWANFLKAVQRHEFFAKVNK